MEHDRWEPFEGEILPSHRLTIRQRMAQLAFQFYEGIEPLDLGDADDE